MIQLEEKLVTYVWPRDLVVISLSLHAHLPGINGMAYSYLPSFQLLYAALVEVVASHDYRPPATLKLVLHGPDRTRQLDMIYCILFWWLPRNRRMQNNDGLFAICAFIL